MIGYTISAIVGAFLFFAGYWFGSQHKQEKADVSLALQDTDSEAERYYKLNQQYLNLMNYTGRESE